MNKNFLILIIGMFLVSSVFALPVYVKPLDGSGDLQPSTSFDYVFNFTTNIDCTGVVLSNSSTIVTAKDGVGFVDIDVSGITSVPSYLCEYVDDVYRTNHTLSDQLFRDVYARDVNITGNLTLGEKISFTLGGVIDNLVNGWIRITGGLNVTDNIEVGGNVTADWFNGLFNWTTTDEWSSFDGSTFDFNESKLETTYFLASAVNVVTGIGAGDLADIQTYNRVTYNVTEANSDFELIVNFTGITEFTTLLVRHKTSEVAGHSVSIQLWDYSDSVWEGYGLLSEELTSKMQTLGVYDDSEHIEDGIVQVRFYQEEVGNAGHVHQFDWVGLSKGFGTPVGEEIDPLSLHRDGNTPLTANWDEGGFNLTSVTSWFLGIVKWENVFGLNTTIDSLIGINNDSVVNYIGTVNTSMKNYVDWVNTTNTGGGGEGTLTGEGTAGYIPMWNDTSSLNNSVIYQKGSNVGIGTTTPQQELNVEGDGNITGSLYVLGQNISATTGGTDTFVANYSDFLTHISWTDLINGTFLGDIWTTLFNGTMATTAYVGIQNTSLVNYIGTVNTSMKNYVDTQDAAVNAITLDSHDSTFFMPLNTSVYGNFDFNGGWTGGGFSISGGDIYAQKGWFYDISSLEVSTLSINGSILPHIDFNNQFDLGNSTLNWRNLFIGTAAYIGGLLNVSGNLTVDTDVLHVDVNNNWVGIGTTTPSGRLNVHEGDFNISNAVRGTIFVVENSSGNVGIGVAAPSASNRLEVSGRAQASNFLATGSGAVFSTNTAAADSQYLYTQNTGNVLYYGVDSSVGAFTGLANAGFIYSYNDTAFVIGTNDSERMVVLGSGNVGIGTASPTSELHVVGDLNVTGEIHGNQTMHNYVHNGTEWLPMLSDAEGVQKVFINNSDGGGYWWSVFGNDLYYNLGGVGIGTSTPHQELNVIGDGNFTGSLYVLGQNITAYIGVQNTSMINYIGTVNTSITNTFGSYVPYTGASSNLDLGSHNFTVDTNVLYVDKENDNVGINTASPTATLDVNGSLGFTQQSTTGDGTTTIDWTLGNKFKFTFGAQIETFTFTAPNKPCNLILVIVQDGTGSRTVTWPGTVKWSGGTAPTLTTTGGGIDIASFYYDGTNYFGMTSLGFAVPS